MEWLRGLIEGIDKVSEVEVGLQETKEPIGTGERLIGEVPVELRKIFAYYCSLVDRMKELRTAHEAEHESSSCDGGMCQEAARSLARMNEDAQVAKMAFWRELRDELKCDGTPDLGIREGWKVVEILERNDGPSIRMMALSGADLRGLFGA